MGLDWHLPIYRSKPALTCALTQQHEKNFKECVGEDKTVWQYYARAETALS